MRPTELNDDSQLPCLSHVCGWRVNEWLCEVYNKESTSEADL